MVVLLVIYDPFNVAISSPFENTDFMKNCFKNCKILKHEFCSLNTSDHYLQNLKKWHHQ